jgi:hypothetical protein
MALTILRERIHIDGSHPRTSLLHFRVTTRNFCCQHKRIRHSQRLLYNTTTMKINFATVTVLLVGLAAALPGPEPSVTDSLQGTFHSHISEAVYNTVV